MEIYLSRTEILRLTRSHLGIQSSGSFADQNLDKHLVAVQSAALKVQQDCRWVNAQKRVTVDLGAEQNTLDYPENSGPGSIMAMAVYDAEQSHYWPLECRTIPIWSDQDQQQAAGGDVFEKSKARPVFFEQRHQINLWPFSDKPYKIRIDFMQRGDLPTENSISIVDGMLVAYMAAAIIAKVQMGDDDQGAAMKSLYDDRLQALRGWQNPDTRFPMDSRADLSEDERPRPRFPNWNRGVTNPDPSQR